MNLALRVVEAVTWIKVDKPTFDLVGVVLSSLGLAGICAAIALGLGAVLGACFIARGRRPQAAQRRVSLHLLEAPPR